MAFLEPEQLFAVAISAQRDVDMPIDKDDPDFMMKVMLSPSFIDAMYIDKFCEEIAKNKDFSQKNQYTKAVELIEDTIEHRWIKHLSPLTTYCKKTFVDYCSKKFENSTCIIKTLANCLSIMVAFENMYAYEPSSTHDPMLVQKERFIKKVKERATVEQLIESIEPEDLRGDAIAITTINYYKKMCVKFGKSDLNALFEKKQITPNTKTKNGTTKNKSNNNPKKQEVTKSSKENIVEPNKPKTHNFNKGLAELAGGVILLLIGSSATNGFLMTAGVLGLGKGFYTLFLASSAAIWEKIPKPKVSDKDKNKVRILAIITLIIIIWFVALLIINILLDHEEL